jgi:nucleotide-binding universal stress UspA family protein/hemerythrin-like domain-containing protein
MYKHFLVPLDDTALSSANVESAIALARRLEARITFFHANPDFGATDDGALLRSFEPALFREGADGATHALLAKAVSSGKAAGISCSAVSATSDHPAEAIVAAAAARGCDLVVMASRGTTAGKWSGWLYNSQTERVLRRSPVALLVTRVATVQPITDMDRALGIVQDEHRSIAVVVQSMGEIVREAAAAGGAPDFNSLARMVGYMIAFPQSVHHPKEEQFLHRALRRRTSASESLLGEVEAQHATESALIDRVSECLASAVADPAQDMQPLFQAVNTLSEHVWRHLRLEERLVLPLMRQHLLEEDWSEIAEAFGANDDPRFGDLTGEEFKRLFTRIANQSVRAG